MSAAHSQHHLLGFEIGFGKLSSTHRTGKGQFAFQSQRKAMPKNAIALISHVNEVMLKILQARLQLYVNHELPDIQAEFSKGRGIRVKLPTSIGSSKKQESSRKTSISALLTMPKPLTVWITINCGYADDTTLMAKSEEELKSLLMKVKEEIEKLA